MQRGVSVLLLLLVSMKQKGGRKGGQEGVLEKEKAPPLHPVPPLDLTPHQHHLPIQLLCQ